MIALSLLKVWWVSSFFGFVGFNGVDVDVGSVGVVGVVGVVGLLGLWFYFLVVDVFVGVYGSAGALGDTYTFTSDVGQYVTIVLVPLKQLDDYKIYVRDNSNKTIISTGMMFFCFAGWDKGDAIFLL